MNKKIVKRQLTDVVATISPAKSPLPPIACAIGAEATAVGEAKIANKTTKTSPHIPIHIATPTVIIGTTIKRTMTTIAKYMR